MVGGLFSEVVKVEVIGHHRRTISVYLYDLNWNFCVMSLVGYYISCLD